MKNLTELKAIAKSAGYKLKFTGDFASNGKDKLYAMYIGNNRQSSCNTIVEMNNLPLFK